MPTDTFEKTSWSWQLSQFQQQAGEWWEYQFYRFEQALPELPSGWSISPWLGELLKFLFWLVIALFIIWIGWRLWREFSPYLYSWLKKSGNLTDFRVKTHPSESSALLLERSQEFYRQGNYREACRYVYLAMLQQLDKKAIAPHKISRTDGEYLQLLRSAMTSIKPYETLITTHEQLCFGNAEILPDNYEQCRQAYRQISQE
ncbi:MAG: DUF4129 domain-containing protein [Nostoc sp. DedVER02]|uniref:DUF4129 domain-containing protein n=1 Tax=unclassified Nostoc TaxID=2593658 RepID=UPI002AD3E6F1|nr:MULTISPECIES: DUF4129 domain-containing protein [unclassified Nostoc]MDZ7986529.1 DUF4129 domain-containing protein [Nostoc sp. DedVER02]MDZ8115501.1 DUF4129 domain-containing protein [Nostoc sp. DedVER01b]